MGRLRIFAGMIAFFFRRRRGWGSGICSRGLVRSWWLRITRRRRWLLRRWLLRRYPLRFRSRASCRFRGGAEGGGVLEAGAAAGRGVAVEVGREWGPEAERERGPEAGRERGPEAGR